MFRCDNWIACDGMMSYYDKLLHLLIIIIRISSGRFLLACKKSVPR